MNFENIAMSLLVKGPYIFGLPTLVKVNLEIGLVAMSLFAYPNICFRKSKIIA